MAGPSSEPSGAKNDGRRLRFFFRFPGLPAAVRALCAVSTLRVSCDALSELAASWPAAVDGSVVFSAGQRLLRCGGVSDLGDVACGDGGEDRL